MRKLSAEQASSVVDRYRAGESSVSIGRDLGISGKAIRGLLHRRNVLIHANGTHQRRYTCNAEYFSAIDSEPKAYWLGFLAADAAVAPRGALVISLALRDREHLTRLAEALGSTHPIRDYVYPNSSFSRLFIQSRSIVEALTKYGVGPRKTFTVGWPTLVPLLVPHFFRGYVDGDGGFAVSSRGYLSQNVTFHVTSNGAFIAAAQEVLMRAVGLPGTHWDQRRPDQPIYTLRYSGRRQVQRIADHLYADATVWLPRKRQIVERYLNAARNIAAKHARGGMTALGGPPVNWPIVGEPVEGQHGSTGKPPAKAGGR